LKKQETTARMTERLTPEQIENWRKVLRYTFGPYAMIMSDEEIQKHRDMEQSRMDKIKENRDIIK
jgi:hypothetical protein